MCGPVLSGGAERGARVSVDRARRSRRCRAICAVGQHGGAGQRRRRSATSAGSGRVTSSRWPIEARDGERDARSGAADDDGEARRRRRAGAAESAGGVDERQHAVARATSMRWPATERTGWSARRTVRSMRSSGIANGRPPASTSSAAMIASVSGRRIWARRALRRARRSCRTSPPSSRIVARTASMPTPRPEMSLGRSSAVEKPGGEEQLDGARHVDRVGLRRRRSARARTALRGDRARGRCRGRRRAR